MDNTYAFNAFAGRLISHFLTTNNASNFFISPISISTCLGMILLGCRNNSTEQLVNLLEFKNSNQPSNIDTEVILQSYNKLLSNIKSKNAKEKLVLLNKALVRSDSNVLPKYQESLESIFMAQIDDMNSTSHLEINNWVSNNTNGKITSMINGPPDPLDKLILLNAIYFKGNWENKFPKEDSEKGKFMVNNQVGKDVTFMNLPKTKLNHSEFFIPSNSDKSGVSIVELPYEGTTSMIILLPINMPVESLVSTPQSLQEHLKTFDETKKRMDIIVSLPKFKLESELSLTSTLSDLGAGDIVTPGLADLSGIDGSKNLYVSNAIHKAAIEVDEDGSEAAASSQLTITMRSFQFVPEFIVDRPFLFVIRDRNTNLVLFVGKVNEP